MKEPRQSIYEDFWKAKSYYKIWYPIKDKTEIDFINNSIDEPINRIIKAYVLLNSALF